MDIPEPKFHSHGHFSPMTQLQLRWSKEHIIRWGRFVMVGVPFFLPTVWLAIKGRNDLNNTALQKVPNCVQRAPRRTKTGFRGRRVKTSPMEMLNIQDSDLHCFSPSWLSTWMSHAKLRRQKELLIVCRPGYRTRGRRMLLGCLIKLMCNSRRT